MKINSVFWVCLIFGRAMFNQVQAQVNYNLDQAIDMAIQNNKRIKAAQMNIDQLEHLKRASMAVPKTNIGLVYGQANSIQKKDNNFQINQTIPFPTFFSSNHALGNSKIKEVEWIKKMSENDLKWQVKQQYYQLLFLYQKKKILLRQDSIASSFLSYATLREKEGEGTALEQTSAETQRFNILNQIHQNDLDIAGNLFQLQLLMGSELPISIDTKELEELQWDVLIDSMAVKQNPRLAYYQAQINTIVNEKRVALSNVLPELSVGYFNQSLIGPQNVNGTDVYFDVNKRFQGVQVFLAIPLFYGSYHHQLKAKEIDIKIAETNLEYEQLNFEIQFKQAVQEFSKNRNNLTYYKNYAIPNANEILRAIEIGYSKGNIDYAEFLLNLSQVIQIQQEHLNAILNYNLSIIYLDYLSGNI